MKSRHFNCIYFRAFSLLALFFISFSFTVHAQEGDSQIDLFFNRFGENFTLSDITINRNLQGYNGCECSDLGFDTGFFDVWFEDCEFTTSGFNDPLLGEDRRAVVCQVYSILADIIELQSGGCGTFDQIVNVRIMPSEIVQELNITQLLSVEQQGIGSALYHIYEGNIVNGMPWEIINTGQIPEEWGTKVFHSEIRINFNSPIINWWTDFNVAPPNNSGLVDLYTAVFHEAIHTLGFTSLFEVTNGIFFSEFDRSIIFGNTNDGFNDILSNQPEPSFNWDLVLQQADFYNGCEVVNSSESHLFFQGVGATDRYPILADNSTPILLAQSHSHLNIDCGGNFTAPFLMHWELPVETRREITFEETDILCQLGYTMNIPPGLFNSSIPTGFSCGCTVAGAEDNGANCSSIYEISLCETLTLNTADLIANDVNVDDIIFLDVQNFIYGTVDDPVDTNNDNIFVFSPSQAGLAVLSYIPVGCNGKQGNLTNIFVQVVPNLDCSATFDCNIDLACDIVEPFECLAIANDDCSPLSDCNQICNPQFCGVVYSDELPAINPPVIRGILNFPYAPQIGSIKTNVGIVPGWVRASGTPDIFVNTSSGDGFILLNGAALDNGLSQNSEGVMTFIPFEEKRYLISLEFSGNSVGGEEQLFLIDIIDGAGLSTPPEVNSPAIYNGIQQNILTQEFINAPQ
ncbi:MAG: hypothetical protein MK105_19495, partial [Crocinitomicaceae bacterium]|nr:hypothetical protein [Crocinitomicaceae bacterium]